MGRGIFKVAPDVDLYVEWSSIVDGPLAFGNRSEMLSSGISEDRLARADETGTSYRDYGFTWDDSGVIVEQRGWLPRDRWVEFFSLWYEHGKGPNHDPDDEVWNRMMDMLEPFEDNLDDDGNPIGVDRTRWNAV